MIMRTPGKYQCTLEPRAKLKVVVNMHGPIRSNRVLRPVQVSRVRGTKGKQVGNVEPGGIFPPGKSCTAPYCLIIYFCIRCGWIKHHKCHRTIARIPGPYAHQGISIQTILADSGEFIHDTRNILPEFHKFSKALSSLCFYSAFALFSYHMMPVFEFDPLGVIYRHIHTSGHTYIYPHTLWKIMSSSIRNMYHFNRPVNRPVNPCQNIPETPPRFDHQEHAPISRTRPACHSHPCLPNP